MDLNNTPKVNKSVHSAVMVLHDLSTDSLILTKRCEHLRQHPGEISFPGGLWEEGDQSYYETALRELYEELGVSKERVTLVRKLQEERTLAGVIIHPWLAQITSIEPYILNSQEVTSIIAIPLVLVSSANNYREIKVNRKGIQFNSWEFVNPDEFIWGATVRIMKQLIISSI